MRNLCTASKQGLVAVVACCCLRCCDGRRFMRRSGYRQGSDDGEKLLVSIERL